MIRTGINPVNNTRNESLSVAAAELFFNIKYMYR